MYILIGNFDNPTNKLFMEIVPTNQDLIKVFNRHVNLIC